MTTLLTAVLLAVLAWLNFWAFRKVFAGLPGAQKWQSTLRPPIQPKGIR